MLARAVAFLVLAAHAALLSAGPRMVAHGLPPSQDVKAVAAWLKASGREGYLAADVADAAGIPRHADEDLIDARQRGFRSGEALHVAQVSADAGRDFLLFMVERPGGEVEFYFATQAEGLKKAFVSFPLARTVVPMAHAQAERAFREQLAYWHARVAGR